ncbi:MAG: MFS transporter [Bacteroidota bacterium]
MKASFPLGLIIILMLAYACSFADRYLLNLLVEPIQTQYGFSDLQMSWLLGPAFGLFYALVGLPIGLAADKFHRGKLISIGVMLWSIMTMLTGLAHSFVQFFICRMGVGIGEASLSPAAYSLLAERVSPQRLSSAIAIYSLGIYIGAALAYGLGGELLNYYQNAPNWEIGSLSIPPWQLLFVGFGLPGVFLSIIAYFAIRELRTSNNKSLSFNGLSHKKQWQSLSKHFYLLCLSFSFFYIAIYAGGAWLPTFLMRVHELPTQTVGWLTSVGLLIFPSIGLLVGGGVADRMSKRNPLRGKVKFCLYVFLFFVPSAAAFGLIKDTSLSLWALLPYALLLSATVGVGAAIVQHISQADKRAFASALFLFAQNCLGLSLGPTAVAFCTDYLFADPMALGYSLSIVGATSSLLATGCMYWLWRRINADQKVASYSPATPGRRTSHGQESPK